MMVYAEVTNRIECMEYAEEKTDVNFWIIIFKL